MDQVELGRFSVCLHKSSTLRGPAPNQAMERVLVLAQGLGTPELETVCRWGRLIISIYWELS